MHNKIIQTAHIRPSTTSIYHPVRYEFRFCSLISPSSLPVTPITNRSDYRIGKARKVLFKKSFLLSSWLYYLARRDHYKSISADQANSIKLSILPARQRIYTLTKAPMAHKTNSKEQFMFKYYNFKFSARLELEDQLTASCLSQGALIARVTTTKFPSFGTNIMFLKYARIYYPVKDVTFFKNLF